MDKGISGIAIFFLVCIDTKRMIFFLLSVVGHPAMLSRHRGIDVYIIYFEALRSSKEMRVLVIDGQKNL